MHPIKKQTLGVLIAVVTILAPLYASAQIVFALRPPVEVRMSGVWQPFDEQGSHALNTLSISLDNQKRLFKVTRIDTLTGFICIQDRTSYIGDVALAETPTT
ncbi:MAG: hypothetical protein AB7G75_02655 [Candidatus Binatia bacterium]